MNPGLISRTAAVLLLGALVGNAIAANAFQSADNYVSARFTIDDGLPDDVVESIVQAQDGFLRLDTGGILTRFDGRHFMTLKPPRDIVTALALSGEGDLWIATVRGLERIAPDGLRLGMPAGIHYPVELSPDDHIVCLHRSRNGAIWAGSLNGLYRFQGNVLKLIVPGIEVYRIEEAADDHLLLVTAKGFSIWDGARIVPQDEVAAQLE